MSFTAVPSDGPPHVRTVLVVDDSVYWTDTLAEAFRREGYIVSAVKNGLTAIERLRENPPDILVTDYFLPDVDGGKLCQIAKRIATDNAIITIILTGGADRNLKRRPTEHADAVIAKNATDIVVPDLLRAIRALVDATSPTQLGPNVIGHERLRPRALSTKLHGLRQHLDALHEGIGDAVIGVDAEQRVYFMNSKALELLSVAEEHAIARRIDAVLSVEATHPIVQRVVSALESGEDAGRPLTVELQGSKLRITVARLKNPSGMNSALLIARDISDLIAAEAERASLATQLHAADKMRSLGQMTAGVSHEINNPLAALLPSLKILQDRFNDVVGHLEGCAFARADNDLVQAVREVPELLSDAIAAGRQIKSVVAEMRFFAHPASKRGERTSVEELLNTGLSLISREVRFKARVERDYGASMELILDRSLVGQALLNILINASQAVANGTPEDSWIRVKTYELDSGVAIEISNSGPGIPPSISGRIFEPFFTTKEPGAGVGLGLSIAYESVRRHGGYIEVVDGLPTTLRVWLPSDTGKVAGSVPPMDPANAVSGSRERIAPPRVLIVDDERLVRNGFRRLLDRHYAVTLAEGGRQALELIRNQRFDVILCDLLMPQMTGMELYETVRNEAPLAAERFVFLTGGTACAEAREFLSAVDNARAFKPLDNEELVALVERAVNRVKATKDCVA